MPATTDDLGVPSSLVRPLTARSVVASTLLGTDPPRLPVAFLVRTAALFGLAEGTVRTALSRMVAAGEVTTDGDGRYELRGDLVERQQRQRASREARTVEWSGRWRMVVVTATGRPAAERAGLRDLLGRRRLAELREGVWLRPDNLAVPPGARVPEGCSEFVADPDRGPGRGDEELAAQLWDLPGWSDTAQQLRRAMHELSGRLSDGDTSALAPGFVVSAAVLRHFGADPLLPRELSGRDWPGEALRRDYDRYDATFREVLAGWSRAEGPPG